MPDALNLDRMFDDPGSLVSDWHRDFDGWLHPLADFTRRFPPGMAAGGVYLVGFGRRRMTALVAGHSEDIGHDLALLALDRQITAFRRYGGVYASFITAPAAYRSGIERFLIERLHPVLADRMPLCDLVPVELPAEFGGRENRRPPSYLV